MIKSIKLNASDYVIKAVVLEELGPGHVIFTVCDICGDPQWRCTISDVPDEVTVRLASEYASENFSSHYQECLKCMEVQRRTPEVFNWVRKVLFHQRSLSKAMLNTKEE